MACVLVMETVFLAIFLIETNVAFVDSSRSLVPHFKTVRAAASSVLQLENNVFVVNVSHQVGRLYY